MEPAGLKGGWRSFTTSVFGSGGGGVGSGGRGGGGECLSLHLDHLDSLVSVGEDEGPGEDVSLLENRPVDQKKLRKRSHGHTQKLEDSDMMSSRVPPPIERCQKNKPHSVHHHSKTQPNGSSLSISSNSSSSSSKLQSNLEGIAGGELLWQEEGCTSSGVSTADAADPSKSTDFEQHSSVQKNFVCISNRARHSFIDGILFTKQLAKEPALGNLIDFDNDGLNN